MSAKRTLAEQNRITVWPKNADKLKALAAVDGLDWHNLANDIIDTFLAEHRSNKPLVLPDDRFTERNSAAEWDGACL